MTDGVKEIVKFKKELNTYLKEHNYHHAHSTSLDTESITGLEQSLSDFTDLDILDENNKFACRNCKYFYFYIYVTYVYIQYTYIF